MARRSFKVLIFKFAPVNTLPTESILMNHVARLDELILDDAENRAPLQVKWAQVKFSGTAFTRAQALEVEPDQRLQSHCRQQ